MAVIGNKSKPAASTWDTTGAPAIPAFSISQVDGDALIAFVATNDPPAPPADLVFADGFESAGPPATATTVGYSRDVESAVQGDVLASFSYRGPVPALTANSTKLDISAPGVNIYAGTDPLDGDITRS